MSTIATQAPGKSWSACPTRSLLANRLVDGKIQSSDAIFVWDFGEENGNQVYINIEVGLNPTQAFEQLGCTPDAKKKFDAWRSQWRNSHGGGHAAGWMTPPDAKQQDLGIDGPWSNTPERLVAGWLSAAKIPLAEYTAVMERLESRIENFSASRVEALAKEHAKIKETS
jgi:hypothetical protein